MIDHCEITVRFSIHAFKKYCIHYEEIVQEMIRGKNKLFFIFPIVNTKYDDPDICFDLIILIKLTVKE